MSLCPESEYRASLSDADFWAHVYPQTDGYPDDPYPDDPYPPEVALIEPCPTCGAVTACGYDDEGRPLIHATTDEDEVTR